MQLHGVHEQSVMCSTGTVQNMYVVMMCVQLQQHTKHVSIQVWKGALNHQGTLMHTKGTSKIISIPCAHLFCCHTVALMSSRPCRHCSRQDSLLAHAKACGGTVNNILTSAVAQLCSRNTLEAQLNRITVMPRRGSTSYKHEKIDNYTLHALVLLPHSLADV
jgi:hypothetical protein